MITEKEAKERLRKKGGHCYLTRYSKSQDCYVLSVLKPQQSKQFWNFKIAITEKEEKRIDGLTKKFGNITSLLEYYEHNRIDPGLRSIGRACKLNEDKLCFLLWTLILFLLSSECMQRVGHCCTSTAHSILCEIAQLLILSSDIQPMPALCPIRMLW